jgi:peptide/nickel transport system permease protein
LRWWRSGSFIVGAAVVVLLLAGALGAPWLAHADPQSMDMLHRLLPPGRDGHLLGTDNFGRDLFARLLYGARLSLGMAVLAVLGSATFGVAVGLVSGFYGGWVDLVTMRIVDIFLGFPVIVLALALVAALGPGSRNIVIALWAVFWTGYARVVRASVLSERTRDYAEAVRAAGASDFRVMVRHILPNVLGPVIVLATLGLGTAILAESGLSFLGVGVQPPAPSWGWTLAYGMNYLRSDPWLSTFPGAAIMLSVLGFNLMGDGLRDLLDPKTILR